MNNNCENRSVISIGRQATRDNNMDLLKILAMLFIITLHTLGHGGVLKNTETFSLNYYTAWFSEALAFGAVNMYVLISGYFLVDKTINLRKVLKLFLHIFFYSVTIYFILLISNQIDFSLKNVIYSLFPIGTKQYWFATIYFSLYLISPMLNIAIKNITEKQLKNSIILLLFLFSIYSNLFYFKDPFDVKGGYGLLWFITLYLIAAYLKLYFKKKIPNYYYLIGYLVLSILIALSKFIIEMITLKLVGEAFGEAIFYSYNSILVVSSSILLFLFFKNLKVENLFIIKIIRYFSPLTFGIYLIHDNRMLRSIIWRTLKPSDSANEPFFIFHLLFIVLIVFVGCSIIEKLRILSFEYFAKFRTKPENLLQSITTHTEMEV